MRTMQETILTAATDASEDLGFQVSGQSEYANTGTIYVLADGLRTVATLAYSFQSTYCTLRLGGPGVAALEVADNPPEYRVERGEIVWHHLDYVDGARLRHFLDILAHAAIEGGKA